MKTQVIQLDLNDDVVSVRDKMSWVKTERILLVFPRSSRLLSRRLDLTLLERHARTLGAQLGMVSRSLDARNHFAENGLPAFRSVGAAQREIWQLEKRTARPPRHHKRPDLEAMRQWMTHPEASWRSRNDIRLGIFSLAVLAILAVLSLFIPSATIQVRSASRVQSLTFGISASPDVTMVNLAGSLPVHIASLVVEESRSIPTTGSVLLPDDSAQGLARFRNLGTEAVDIPAGTQISTQSNPAVTFVTLEAASVSAGFNQQVVVPIQAVEAGSQGNLPADVLVVIGSELGTRLAVTNIAPTQGGTDSMGAIQTSEDRASLREALLADILEKCRTDLPQTLADGDVFFPESLEVTQVLSESYFPAEGQSGESVSLTLRLQCQVQYAAQAEVAALAEMSLDAGLLEETFVPGSADLVAFPASTPVTGEDGVTHWDLTTQRTLYARLDARAIQQLVLGRRPEAASRLLSENLSLEEAPEIQVSPGWWPWMPLIPFRIHVSMEQG